MNPDTEVNWSAGVLAGAHQRSAMSASRPRLPAVALLLHRVSAARVTRRARPIQTGFLLLVLVACTCAVAQPYQATGLKICEVDATSAIVWTRLTLEPQPVSVDGPNPTITYGGKKRGGTEDNRPDVQPEVTLPDGVTVDQLQGAAAGTGGQTRVRYRARGEEQWQPTPWGDVDASRDYTRQHRLTNLVSGTVFEIRVEGRAAAEAPVSSTLDGQFRTAPDAASVAPVRFTVITGQNYHDRDLPTEGWKIYDPMLRLQPDFFAHTGDILYYDSWAKSLPLARWMWQQVYGMPTNIRFHRQVASYFIKDDHDTWMNDCYPTMQTAFMGDFTFAQGQAVFLEQVGMGDRTFRTIRWGRDLQVWLIEGRDFRSPNNAPDGPDKTIWGDEQKTWFKRTVLASDATFRVLISPTPLVGPDRGNKNDNHANQGFTHEGDELRAFCASQTNLVIVCGDRHWQYVSVDPETGLREYSCGPTTDAHAGGWPKDKREPEHRYLNVVGGFLEGVVDRRDDLASLTFRHYSVDGQVLNEEVLRAR
jgi:alkaline phosphatase D